MLFQKDSQMNPVYVTKKATTKASSTHVLWSVCLNSELHLLGRKTLADIDPQVGRIAMQYTCT